MCLTKIGYVYVFVIPSPLNEANDKAASSQNKMWIKKQSWTILQQF